MAYGAPSKTRDKPGGANKRNFNHPPRGRFGIRIKHQARSKSRSSGRK